MSEHTDIKNLLECEVCNIYYEKGKVHCVKCGNKLVDASLRTFVKYLTKEESKKRILLEFGEEGFDTFTGYLDWYYLELNSVLMDELSNLETAKVILSNSISIELLQKYDLKKEQSDIDRVQNLINRFDKKISDNNYQQCDLECDILFSLVAAIYIQHFNYNSGRFPIKEYEDIVKLSLHSLVDYYSALILQSNLKDRKKIFIRKLIIFTSMLFDLYNCYDLGDIIPENLHIDCEKIIIGRIQRATMLNEIYKEIIKTSKDSQKIRSLCSEIIADLKQAFYIQSDIHKSGAEKILEIIIEKLGTYQTEGVELDYFQILEFLFDELTIQLEGVGLSVSEISTKIKFYISLIEHLNKLKITHTKEHRKTDVYLRAFEFYNKYSNDIIFTINNDKFQIESILRFLKEYYKIENKDGWRHLLCEEIRYFYPDMKNTNLKAFIDSL